VFDSFLTDKDFRESRNIAIKFPCALLVYRSPNIVSVIKSRRLRWAGHVDRMEEPIGKRPLGRPRRRWEDNIRMDLEEIGINEENWVDSAQDRNYWRALVNLRVP